MSVYQLTSLHCLILDFTLENVKKMFQENRLLSPLPFNSGYFLTFRLVKNVSDAVRKVLLHDYGIGVIAVNEEYLRVAFSTVELENIEPLIEKIYDIASEII